MEKEKKEKKIWKYLIIILLILLIIALIIGGYFLKLYLYPTVSFSLKGEEKYLLSYGDKYEEAGAEAKVNGKDYNKKIKIDSSNVKVDELGEYKINYSITLPNGKQENLERIIKVVDDVKPEIKLKGDNPLKISYGSIFTDPGYEVSDNYDKSDTLKVEVTFDKEINTKESGTYKITYTVTDSNHNSNSIVREVVVIPRIVVVNGITYVEGILIVNKKYSLPANYNPGENKEAANQLYLMRMEAAKYGYDLRYCSGFRSYNYQTNLYNNYVKKYGQAMTDTFSAKPGHSEHQTGLAFDIGAIDDNFGDTETGKWLAINAHKYGFIIRYPKGKQDVTGYKYEPWHVRYLGVELATKVYKSGLTLEEYLNI